MHTVKEQFVPEDNRGIALFNTDNEFNRAINEDDIDFNIPGPRSAVKQSHGASVRDLIQKIENHPHRHALQRDLLQQRQQFNSFSQESKDMIPDVGNIALCGLLHVEPKAQCKVCLPYWDVGIVYCTCGHFLRNGTEENKKFFQYTMDLLSILNYYNKERATPRAPLREEARGSRVLHRAFAQEEMQEEKFLGYSRPVHPR